MNFQIKGDGAFTPPAEDNIDKATKRFHQIFWHLGCKSHFKAETELHCKKDGVEVHKGTWTWGFKLNFATGNPSIEMDDPIWTKK